MSDKRKRTRSAAQQAASRANGRKSRGPKDPSHSRFNARKSGLYSSQLLIADEEQQTFEELRAGILADLRPQGTLLTAAAEEVAIQHWRPRIALGLEQQELAEQRQRTQILAAGVAPPPARPRLTQLKQAFKLVGGLEAALECLDIPPRADRDLARPAG
jgi:hypothetical protein